MMPFVCPSDSGECAACADFTHDQAAMIKKIRFEITNKRYWEDREFGAKLQSLVDRSTGASESVRPTMISPGEYTRHKFWGSPELTYPCGHCGMSFRDGNHFKPLRKEPV